MLLPADRLDAPTALLACLVGPVTAPTVHQWSVQLSDMALGGTPGQPDPVRLEVIELAAERALGGPTTGTWERIRCSVPLIDQDGRPYPPDGWRYRATRTTIQEPC